MTQSIMKKILFITALMLVAMQAMSANVDMATAQMTAQQFAAQRASMHRIKPQGNNGHVTLVHTESSKKQPNQADYYIFNTDGSFIIVAGDDRADEVLAYGDSPLDMNNIPCGMQYWLDCYKEQMEYLLANPSLTVEKTSRHMPARQAESVPPLLTALWDQSAPYYNQCPVSDGRHCLTGCAATSLSMVMYYWKYPTQPTPSVPGYVTNSLGMQINGLPSTTFDWDNMLDYYRWNYNTTQANAVAYLMRYVGQAEQMDYTPESSGTYGDDILETVEFFGYDNDATIVYKDWWDGYQNYTDEEWAEIIQNELYAGRPIVMCGYANAVGGLSGHAFNIDGYDAEQDMYHINWGWGGSGNAHFVLNAFRGSSMTFNIGQQLIIGIEPPATVPTIKASTFRLNMNAMVEHSSNMSFFVKGKLLTSGVDLTLNDNTGSFTLLQDHISLSELTNGKRVHVVYSPSAPGSHIASITLSSNGAQDVTIALNGTAILETYDPVMLDVSNVEATSFVANWKDATPAHNVSFYNLETGQLPYSEPCLQETFEQVTASTTDCSSRLDEITSTPGWTGSKVYPGDHYLRIGNSKSKGWLETPALDMRDSNGKVTVKVNAKCVGSEESALLTVSCGENDTTITVNAEEAEYCALLPCNTGTDVKVRFTNSITTQRVLITSAEVIVGDAFSPIDESTIVYHEGITAHTYHVTGLQPSMYAMRVQAVYTDGHRSSWSNRITVQLDGDACDVNHDGEINLSDANVIIGTIINNDVSHRKFMSCDVNGDGEVNIADLNILIGIIITGH